MEQLILIVALAVMALIAMGQCAHHSSHRRGSLNLPAALHSRVDPARTPGHPAGAARTQEPATTAPEREPVNAGNRD